MSPSLLIYSTLPHIGGNSTNTLTVAQQFRKLGWTVSVLTRNDVTHGLSQQNIDLLRGMGCEVEVLTGASGGLGLHSLKALLWTRQRSRGAVFVTLCMGSVSPLLARIGSFRKSVFYLITHEERPEVLGFLIKSKNLFTEVAVVSPITEQPLKKLLGADKPVSWLPQFSDFSDGAKNMTDKAPGRKLTFGFLGTVSQGKGVHLLLDLWPQLKIAADLRIAGDGPLRPRVEDMAAAAKNSAAAVHYAGAFNAATRQEFLDRFFHEIDYLIVPSVNTMEGIPTVILEALSYGVPVLASSLGGTACFGLDWLKPAYPNVVRLFELEHLADAVNEFAAQGLPSHDYQFACVQYYRLWFSTESVLKRWVELTK